MTIEMLRTFVGPHTTPPVLQCIRCWPISARQSSHSTQFRIDWLPTPPPLSGLRAVIRPAHHCSPSLQLPPAHLWPAAGPGTAPQTGRPTAFVHGPPAAGGPEHWSLCACPASHTDAPRSPALGLLGRRAVQGVGGWPPLMPGQPLGVCPAAGVCFSCAFDHVSQCLIRVFVPPQ